MAVALYMDVHVPLAISEQLRRREVDVVTAIEDGFDRNLDEEVLERAQHLGRVLFTQDIRFKALAEEWQRQGRSFAGLIFGHQIGATIGRYVADLELIALASEPTEWRNVVGIFPSEPAASVPGAASVSARGGVLAVFGPVFVVGRHT